MRNFLDKLLAQIWKPFSLAVCGSAAAGEVKGSSDIELLVVVDKADVKHILQNQEIRDTFDLRISQTVIERILIEEIDAVRLPEITYEGITFCVNVYTKHLCQKIATLRQGLVIKFRDAPKTEALDFRGFGWHTNGDTIRRYPHNSPCGEGSMVASEIVYFQGDEPYFHIYVDKFYTALLVWDMLNVRSLQVELSVSLSRLQKQSRHPDMNGFLYNSRTVTAGQIQRIRDKVGTSDNDAFLEERQSHLFHLSGPTGVGKDSIIKALREKDRTIGIVVPYTTRTPRAPESAAYHHIDQFNFLAMIRDEQFVFWHYDGMQEDGTPKYYGIRRDDLIKALVLCSKVLFSIGGTTAARFLKARFPFSTTICLYPESIDQLRTQIEKRDGCVGLESHRRLDRLQVPTMGIGSCFDVALLNAPGRLRRTIEMVAGILEIEQHL